MPESLQSTKRWMIAVFTVLLLTTVCFAQEKPSASAQKRPPAPRPAPVRVTRATLRAIVPRGKPCPIKVIFAGTITTSGSAEVKYTWVSFDGGSWPEHTLKFAKAGTENVSESREVSETGNGWMQLKVVAPNTVLSPRGNYRVTCMKPVPGRK